MKLKAASFLLAILLILSACNPTGPIEADWCYTYDFTESDYDINIMSGSWVDGEGIQTDSTGLLQANWVHSELVTPAVIVIKATRPAGTIGDVTVTANAIAFGVAISFTETLPGSFNEVIVPITPETAGESGTSVNFTLDASQPLTLESVEIRGQFDNPFPINYCGDISETPTVAITDTPSPVPTGTPTPTPTGTLATPTPTATPDINFYVMDATGSGSWSVGFPDIAAENFNILRESSDPIAGIYYNITVTFTGDGPHELSVYPDYAGAYSPFAIGNEFNGVQFLLLYTQNQDFGFGFLSDTTLANLIDADTGYTRLFHINAGALSGLQAISVGANTVHQADFYYRQQVVVNWARLVYYGAPPDATNTPTPTQTAIPTRTPFPTFMPPTPRATRTPIIIRTPTPQMSATPSTTPSPAPSSTPAPTGTPLPTSTPFILSTPIPGDPNPNPATENEAEFAILDSVNNFFDTLEQNSEDIGDVARTASEWASRTAQNSMTEVGNLGAAVRSQGETAADMFAETYNVGQMATSLFGGAMNLGLGWFSGATTRLSNVFTGFFNAPARTIPGLPLCITAPLESDLCAFWYILDWTIFAPNTPGAFFVPILTAVLNIAIVLYFIDMILKAVKRIESITEVAF